MDPQHVGFWQGIADNLGGAGELRLVVQPLVAIVLGIRLGISDAHEGRTPYVVGLRRVAVRDLPQRLVSDIIVPFCVAIVVDCILQHYTLGRIRPLAALIVAGLIVWLPFAAARGFTNRIIRRSAHAEA